MARALKEKIDARRVNQAREAESYKVELRREEEMIEEYQRELEKRVAMAA